MSAMKGTGTLTTVDDGTVSVKSRHFTSPGTAGSTGTLNIGAAATDAAAAAGILDADTLTFVAGAGMLVFNHTDTRLRFRRRPHRRRHDRACCR